MRALALFASCVCLSGCAFTPQVQRFGVEYNAALAEMNNEQTLLNILRAKDGMPTHFTSVSQFRGSISLTASANLNAQLRGEGLTQVVGSSASNTVASTNSTTSLVGASPTTTSIASTVTTPVSGSTLSSTVAEGVDVYTPQVSGQIVSGTNFDVAVFDTQKFYQGITTGLPFTTVEALLSEGFDERLLEFLLISRIDFRLVEAAGEHSKGEVVLSVINDPVDEYQAKKFAHFVNCYALGAGVMPRKLTNVIAVSRLTRGADGKVAPLAIDKVTVIDGEKFALSGEGGIGDDAVGDKDIYLARVSAERRVPRFSAREVNKCKTDDDRVADINLHDGNTVKVIVPIKPPKDAVYLGESRVLLFDGKDYKDYEASMEVSFRSPEGLYRYIGSYLAYDNGKFINIESNPLFTISSGRVRGALASATYRGQSFSLVNEPGSVRNAQIFTLLQRLINLHKEAADRPTVVPVRAIP